MGIISSKETRRVSFDNSSTLAPALNIQTSIKDDNIIELLELTSDEDDKLYLKDYSDDKSIDITEERDGDYWAHRIEFLKKEHLSINKIIESEYERTVDNANRTYELPQITNDKLEKIKPCIDWRAKILKCYEDNSHQPLICSALVKAFSQSVSACRSDE